LEKDLAMAIDGCHFHALNILLETGVLGTRGSEYPFQMGDTMLVPRPVETYTVATSGCKILNTFL
jgi:hypothetical protein